MKLFYGTEDWTLYLLQNSIYNHFLCCFLSYVVFVILFARSSISGFLIYMAVTLASHRCCYRGFEQLDRGRIADDLSFSGSISNLKYPKFETFVEDILERRPARFVSEGHQLDSNRVGINGHSVKSIGLNGRVTRMVSTKEIVKSKGSSNGRRTDSVNGSKVAVNRVSIMKKNSTSALVRTQRKPVTEENFFDEELKVLPSDENFSWAKENYSSWQRTIDVWSFVLSLRVRVLFDNAKWAYPDGFTEDKQVIFLLFLFGALLLLEP